jgi:hypothetical protein
LTFRGKKFFQPAPLLDLIVRPISTVPLRGIMKAAWYERQGPPASVLVVGEMATPEPGPGEVRIRVAAYLTDISSNSTSARNSVLSAQDACK